MFVAPPSLAWSLSIGRPLGSGTSFVANGLVCMTPGHPWTWASNPAALSLFIQFISAPLLPGTAISLVSVLSSPHLRPERLCS